MLLGDSWAVVLGKRPSRGKKGGERGRLFI